MRRESARSTYPVSPGGDQGLTLIEVMVAVMILMLAIAALALVMTRAFAAVALGRQSQQATNLADAVIAQDEATAWTTIQNGLLSTDTTFLGDEGTANNIVPGASGYCFEGLPVIVDGMAGTGCNGTSTTWYNLAPLASCASSVAPDVSTPVLASGGNYYLLHQECVTMNGTNYEIGVYPTQVGAASPGVTVQVTVAVSWGAATSRNGMSTHVTDSAILSCGTTYNLTNGLPAGGCP